MFLHKVGLLKYYYINGNVLGTLGRKDAYGRWEDISLGGSLSKYKDSYDKYVNHINSIISRKTKETVFSDILELTLPVGPLRRAPLNYPGLDVRSAESDDSSIDKYLSYLIYSFYIEIFRSSLSNQKTNPLFGPPIITINYGLMYKNVKCLVKNVSIAPASYKSEYSTTEVGDPTDVFTGIPRKLKVSFDLTEVGSICDDLIVSNVEESEDTISATAGSALCTVTSKASEERLKIERKTGNG
jgi:hypothetical protein